MSKMEREIIILIDEDNKEINFELLKVVEYNEQKYVVLLPDGADLDNDESFILRLETDEDGEEVLVDIEDDEEFLAVCDVLDKMELEDGEYY